MDGNAEFKDLMIEAEERRRNAYVDSVTMKAQGIPMAGIMGTHVPVPVLRAYGIVPLFIMSTDGHAEEFNQSDRSCMLLRSTEGYSVSGKCPLIYSVSSVITDNICKQRRESLPYVAQSRPYMVYEGMERSSDELFRFAKSMVPEGTVPDPERAIFENNRIFLMLRELHHLFRVRDIRFSEAATIASGFQYSLTMKEKKAYLERAIRIIRDLPDRQEHARRMSSVFYMGSEGWVHEDDGSDVTFPENLLPSERLFCDGEQFRFIEELPDSDPLENILRAYEKKEPANGPELICSGCTTYGSHRRRVIYSELFRKKDGK